MQEFGRIRIVLFDSEQDVKSHNSSWRYGHRIQILNSSGVRRRQIADPVQLELAHALTFAWTIAVDKVAG